MMMMVNNAAKGAAQTQTRNRLMFLALTLGIGGGECVCVCMYLSICLFLYRFPQQFPHTHSMLSLFIIYSGPIALWNPQATRWPLLVCQ